MTAVPWSGEGVLRERERERVQKIITAIIKTHLPPKSSALKRATEHP